MNLIKRIQKLEETIKPKGKYASKIEYRWGYDPDAPQKKDENIISFVSFRR